MPSELYLVRLIHHQTRKAFPGERLWTAEQLGNPATARFLRVRNREGCDVYLQPYAGHQNAGYILVDLDQAQPTVLPPWALKGIILVWCCRPVPAISCRPGFASALRPWNQRWQPLLANCWPPCMERSSEHRLASPGKARRLHQSEARSTHTFLLCSLGEGRGDPRWCRARCRGAAALRPRVDVASPRLCRFDSSRSRPGRHTHLASGRNLSGLYDALAHPRSLPSARLEHRRLVDRQTPARRRLDSRPSTRNSPARQPSVSPPPRQPRRLLAPHRRPRGFSFPQGTVWTNHARASGRRDSASTCSNSTGGRYPSAECSRFWL